MGSLDAEFREETILITNDRAKTPDSKSSRSRHKWYEIV